MPLYEYKCADCERPFELLVASPALADAVVCRYCGSDSVRRLISTFAAHAGGDTYAPVAAAPRAGGGCACGGGGCGCGSH
jgi:putative FmdB family regulatory protein